MTLTTHAIIGGALGAIAFPHNPGVAFAAGFASHFVMDMIPHWDYHLPSEDKYPDEPLRNDMVFRREHILDYLKIALDGAVGIILPILLFGPFSLAVLFGAVGGIVPDALQLAYWKIPTEPLTSLQRLHIWFHAKKHYKDRPIIGVPMQVGIILVTFAISR